MTTPSYTSNATDAAPTGVPRTAVPQSAVHAGWLEELRRRAAKAASHPWLVRATLDVLAIGFIALAFTSTALSAEFIFHCVFVLLVLHAFLFGLRGTLVRIALVSIPLIVYAEARLFGLHEPPLELTEWPLMFVIAVLVAWMADRRRATSARYAALFRTASERLLTVEEDERRRIAGELHDSVGQVLTALTLTLDAAATEPDAHVARRRIGTARSMADTALAGTRDLSHRIRPTRLEERGLVPALRDLAAQSGFPVIVRAGHGTSDPHLLDSTTMVELFRITQEALANAARHSGASQARVAIERLGDELEVTVEDDGSGFVFGQRPTSGIGLAGMQERARLIGGRLAIETDRGSGTRVVVTVPASGGAA